MRKINLMIVATFVVLLVGGCADKGNVGYDDSLTKQDDGSTTTQQQKTESREILETETKTETKNKVFVADKLSYVNVVTSNVNGQDIRLRSVHFAFDKYNLSDTMRAVEKENYAIINPLVLDNTNLKIKLEGNCDEFGTDEYNYALGLKRAKTVKDSLVSDGISASKITLVSLGESNPICDDKSTMCYKKNRRVDHKLLP